MLISACTTVQPVTYAPRDANIAKRLEHSPTNAIGVELQDGSVRELADPIVSETQICGDGPEDEGPVCYQLEEVAAVTVSETRLDGTATLLTPVAIVTCFVLAPLCIEF